MYKEVMAHEIISNYRSFKDHQKHLESSDMVLKPKQRFTDSFKPGLNSTLKPRRQLFQTKTNEIKTYNDVPLLPAINVPQ
jgi:hypothetical protein